MSRPAAHKWHVVDESADPVPGEPEQVAQLGKKLRSTADDIEKQAREIEALDSAEHWQGKTAEKFRSKASGTADKLRKAFERYDKAAKALGTSVKDECGSEYASELHRAQKMADKALCDAEAAHGEKCSAQKCLDEQPEDTPHDDPHKKKSQGKVDDADSCLRSAKEAIETAKSIRDTAADKASDAIRDVIDNDGLKDGWTDKFKNWVKDNSGWLSKISKWAGKIALWAGVVALTLGWIPVIGQAIAAVANAVALVASVVALATDLVLALGGEGSWKSVALDAIGVATFGIGRAAVTGAKGAAAGGKAMARTNLYRGARAAGHNQNKAWKIANRGSQGSVKGKQAAMAKASMPTGKSPGWSSLKEGFSPKAIYQDTADGVKSIKSGMPTLHSPNSLTTLDPDLARSAHDLRNINPNALHTTDVQNARNAFNGHANVWAGSTAGGVLAGSEGAYNSVSNTTSGAYDAVTGN